MTNKTKLHEISFFRNISLLEDLLSRRTEIVDGLVNLSCCYASYPCIARTPPPGLSSAFLGSPDLCNIPCGPEWFPRTPGT